MEQDEVLELVKEKRNSSFNKSNYCVTIMFNRFVESMLLHTYYDAMERRDNIKVTSKDWLERVTPKFQRANNKWTKAMKLKFIENLLSGAKTELLLFRFSEQEDAQIIDGLQRTTAIIDFFNGKVKPFGLTQKEIGTSLNKFRTDVTIKIYTFKKWEEVGKFYIDMNENITHSKKDIQKAKDWFLNEHNIVL